ncbi:MAG: hypothetical protein ABL983_13985 [Nitrospira sp.]
MILPIMPIVLVAAVLNVDAASLPYYDPQGEERTSRAYARKGAGSIPRELNEKVLLQDQSSQLSTDSLVVLVNKEYSVVLEKIRILVAEKMGIAEEHDNKLGAIQKPKETRPTYQGNEWPPSNLGSEWPPWPPLGEGLAFLRDSVESVSHPKEYQLTSKLKERLEGGRGYSAVRIRVTDGRGLLNRNVTILQVRRRDYSVDQDYSHIAGIPLGKKKLSFLLVTDSEVALIESLKELIPGLAVRYFVSHVDELFPPPPANKDEKRVVLESMRAAAEQFEGK